MHTNIKVEKKIRGMNNYFKNVETSGSFLRMVKILR